MDEERELEIEGGMVIAMGNEERDENVSGSLSASDDAVSKDSILTEPLLLKNSRMNNTSQLAIVGAKICPIESLDYEYAFPFLSLVFDFYAIKVIETSTV